MRIHIVSDLHIELWPYEVSEVEADVVVLAGDIASGTEAVPWALERYGDIPVLYVAGNHEYYGQAFPDLLVALRHCAAGTSVRFMENDVVTIGDVRFLGCTLWTDFSLYGKDRVATKSMYLARERMADFSQISKGPEYAPLKPSDTYRLFSTSLAFLERNLAEEFSGKTVVVTHHAPSLHSVPPQYQGDVLSPAFASNLETLMADGNIDLWIHGHTHHCTDYKLGLTRVVSNQRGYSGENVGKFEERLVLSI